MGKMLQSDFYCTECGKKGMPLLRKEGQMREAGHLKKIYCLYCGKETNMVEIRSVGAGYTLQDFEDEIRYGNFKDGKRILPLGEFKKMRNAINRNEGLEDE